MKQKRIPKTKEQIKKDMENIAKVSDLRKFVKDKFYPALIEASTSIDDAKYVLSSFSNMLMEQFLAKMQETNFKELKLEDKLDPKGEKYKQFKKILEIFADDNVFHARELIEGMKGELDMNINNELKGRKLDTLKVNFYE